MKRFFGVLLVLIVLAGCDSCRSRIYLSSPRGGEIWKLGLQGHIAWSVYDWWGSCCHSINAYVRFKSGNRSEQLERIATDRSSSNTRNAGSFDWRVGTTLAGGEQMVLPTGSYTIRVCDLWGTEENLKLCAESGVVQIE